MTGVYYLRDDVVIKELYKDKGLTNEQLESIEEASKDGFTQDELAKLEEANIDTSLIINQSQNIDTNISIGNKTQDDVENKIKELKEKYCQNLKEYNGDVFSASNPQLQALNQALEDGVILLLGKEGYTKTQILQIIEGAFPQTQIKSTGEDGSYNRPIGHGKEAQKIYSRFTSHLLSAISNFETNEIKEKRKELAKINSKITLNNQEIQILEVTIESLQQEVEEQLDKAIEESKDIQDEHKQKAKDCLKNRLEEYKSSNGEMTYEEFKKNISSDLGNFQTSTNRKLDDVICSMLDANRKMGLLNNYLSEIKNLSDENIKLSAEANVVKVDLDKLVKEAEKNATANNSRDPQANLTDPIGFYSEEKRYDFFVDVDGNDDITNETEFLGAQEGFSEVIKLDTNNDGLVNADELNNANIKIIQTNSDGEQEILNASQIFNLSTDGINLSTYKETNKDIGNNNTLLGTFNVSLNNEDLNGYQTLDAHEWLDKNYNFTDEQAGLGRFAKDYVGNVTVYSINSEKINIFEQKNIELSQKADQVFNNLAIDKTILELQTKGLSNEYDKKAKAIDEKFDDIARKDEDIEEWSNSEMKDDERNFEKLYAEILAKNGQMTIIEARKYVNMTEAQVKDIFKDKGYTYNDNLWCADFAYAMLCETIGKENLADWYEDLNSKSSCSKIQYAGANHKVLYQDAQPGDIVLYDWDGDNEADHAGLFVDLGDGNTTITSIEGNTSDTVKEKTQNRKYIIGIYRVRK